METYERIFNEADAAAQQAAEKWLEEALARGPMFTTHFANLRGEMGPPIGTMLDNCGNAYLYLNDRRTAFAKWTLAHDRRLDKHSKIIRINFSLSRRQEMGLAVAAHEAALAVFKKNGIMEISLKSYID